MITVFLAIEQTLFREGLCTALSREGDIKVVGATGNGEAALSLIGCLSPNVVIADNRLPSVDKPDSGRGTSQHVPSASVILVATDSEDRCPKMVNAGATAYFSGRASLAELLEGIRHISLAEHVINKNC